MPALHQTENGTFVLLPYALPYTCDEDGRRQDYGRFCIAYSRDDWFLLDTELDVILGWYVSEEDAISARMLVLS